MTLSNLNLKLFTLIFPVFILSTQFVFSQETKEENPVKKTEEENPVKKKDTSRFTFLNAYDFDVNGIGKSNYLGHVNLNAYSLNGSNWGFNAGIMKISYNSDSSVVRRLLNLSASPLQRVTVGAKYYRQLDERKIIFSNKAYSLYVQPTYCILKSTGGSNQSTVLLHAHAEMFIMNTDAKNAYRLIDRDTLTYTAIDSARNNRVLSTSIDTGASKYNRTRIMGYFGMGATFDLHPWNNGSFFFQPTFGLTTNNPGFNQVLQTQDNDVTLPLKLYGFYLIRTTYTENINDKAKIVLGTDIRGSFTNYKPLYSLYLGLSLNIDALAALIK